MYGLHVHASSCFTYNGCGRADGSGGDAGGALHDLADLIVGEASGLRDRLQELRLRLVDPLRRTGDQRRDEEPGLALPELLEQLTDLGGTRLDPLGVAELLTLVDQDLALP